MLVTGGAGFIGSNFTRYWVEHHPDDHVVVLDLLTYAGNRSEPRRRRGRASRSCRATSPTSISCERVLRGHGIDVDRELRRRVAQQPRRASTPGRFFRTNVLGTQSLLEAARSVGVERFHHISTCEVYGDLAARQRRAVHGDVAVPAPHAVQRVEGRAPTTRCAPTTRRTACPSRSPTAPTTTGRTSSRRRSSRCSRPTPSTTQPLPLYASTENRREWIHALDHCSAIDAVLERGRVGETYHVGHRRREQHRGDRRRRPRRARQARRPEDDRPRPARARPPLRPRLVEDPARARLGAAPSTSIGASPTPSRWYARAPRLVGAAARAGAGRRGRPGLVARSSVRVLVTGAGGQLGRELVDAFDGARRDRRRPRHPRRHRPRRGAPGDHVHRARRRRARGGVDRGRRTARAIPIARSR